MYILSWFHIFSNLSDHASEQDSMKKKSLCWPENIKWNCCSYINNLPNEKNGNIPLSVFKDQRPPTLKPSSSMIYLPLFPFISFEEDNFSSKQWEISNNTRVRAGAQPASQSQPLHVALNSSGRSTLERGGGRKGGRERSSEAKGRRDNGDRIGEGAEGGQEGVGVREGSWMLGWYGRDRKSVV